MRNIIVIGAGFAGLWSALGAARRLDELGISSDDVTITMVNRDAWHSIRVRNYENDISDARVPLADLLDPVGIRLVVGDVTAIDNSARTIGVATETGVLALAYDRLVIAAGSQQHLPDIAGLSEHGFFIDTWEQANALDRHLSLLPDQIAGSGRDTVLIVGAGLTGVELACEMPDRLRGLGLTGTRTIVADTQARSPHWLPRRAMLPAGCGWIPVCACLNSTVFSQSATSPRHLPTKPIRRLCRASMRGRWDGSPGIML
jgi:NADH dehydrogenase